MYKANLHLLEACPCRCRHCFSRFEDGRSLPFEDWVRVIKKLRAGGVTDINLAGGEPLLYPHLSALTARIREEGMRVSIITNGLLLSEQWLRDMAPDFDAVGISVDTFRPELARKIGRCLPDGTCMTSGQFRRLVDRIRLCSPETRIKLNTVVTRENWDDPSMRGVRGVDRRKIFRMKVFETEGFSNRNLSVTDGQFASYVSGLVPGYRFHACPEVFAADEGGEIVVEPVMDRSYLIIDPQGNVIDNKGDASHIAGNLLTDSLEDCARHIRADLYKARYVGPDKP